jgi:hypothetical protein
MDIRSAPGATDRPRPSSFREVAVVALAVTGIILANVGVVRALDVALDAIHGSDAPILVAKLKASVR